MDTFLKKIIKEGGMIAKKFFDKGVTHTTKAHLGDLLTEADMEVSNYLVTQIHKAYPDHHIFSEEMDEEINPGAQYEWVIDPIDGTRNFAMGIPMWCVLVAVLKDGELHMSAVYNPTADELFFAEAGKGATMNEKEIHVNNTETTEHGFGICARSSTDFPFREEFVRAMNEIVDNTNTWVHSFGTMLGVCYVANGGIDFFFANTGYDFDNLAPALIAREAGALVTDCDGNEWKRDRHDIVIANPKLHPKLMEFFR